MSPPWQKNATNVSSKVSHSLYDARKVSVDDSISDLEVDVASNNQSMGDLSTLVSAFDTAGHTQMNNKITDLETSLDAIQLNGC